MTSSIEIKPCTAFGDTLVLYDHSACFLKDEAKIRNIMKLLNDASFIDLTSLRKAVPPTKPVEIVLGGEKGLYVLRTGEYVGFAFSNDTSLIIIPRVFRGRSLTEGMIGFLRMLGMVLDMELSFKVASTAVNDIGNSGVFEVILYLYARMLEAELLKGAHRKYMRIIGEERFIRGKLLISKQVRKPPSRMHLLSVEYYALSINNPLNRVLKMAAYLGARAAKNNKTRIMLSDIVSLFENVGLPKNIAAEIKKVHFNRLNLRFMPVYQLAKIIIYGLKPLEGDKSYSFFIARSEIMFQHLVYKTLVKQLSKLRKDCLISYEQRQRWALVRQLYPKRGDIVLQVPDINIQCSDIQTFVDIKYKDISGKGRPEENDLRQLYVYARILEKEMSKTPVIVFLVYPYLKDSYNADIFGKYKLIVYRYLQKKNYDNNEEPYLIVTSYDLENLLKEGEPYDECITELIISSMECARRANEHITCLPKSCRYNQ